MGGVIYLQNVQAAHCLQKSPSSDDALNFDSKEVLGRAEGPTVGR